MSRSNQASRKNKVIRRRRNKRALAQAKKKNGIGIIVMGVVVILFVAILTVQIRNLREQDAAYAAQQAYLQQELEEETERSSEITEKAAYMQTDEYKEEMAKEKLGLVNENEIIFKESEE